MMLEELERGAARLEVGDVVERLDVARDAQRVR